MTSMSPSFSVIPTPLEEIASFLRSSPVLENQIITTGDGRMASAASERNVISLLQNQPEWNIVGANVESGNNRAGYDFMINGKLFVDLKISKLTHADNTNCKAGIYHVLTGSSPEDAPTHNEGYFKALLSNLKQTESDFYFLIVGKDKPIGDPQRSFVCTLRTLACVSPNGNNLPFQCKWSECMQPRLRTYEQAKEFLLGNYLASLKKQTAALIAFQRCFPDIGREEA